MACICMHKPAIVVIDCPHAVVSVDNEVSLDQVHGLDVAPSLRIMETVHHPIQRPVRLPVPRIVVTVVSRLAHTVKQQVPFQQAVARKPVVLVDVRPRAIIAHIVHHMNACDQR